MKNSNRFGKMPVMFFLLAVSAVFCFGQPQNLSPNAAPQEKNIAAKQIDVYQIALKKGEFARILVEQKGADVAVDLIGADGAKIIERDSPNGVRGAENLSFVAEADTYKIEVKLLDENAAPGKYSIALVTKPNADEKDLLRVAAEKDLQDALALRTENTAESVKRAAEKFALAVAGFHNLGDKYFESLALSSAVFLDVKAEKEAQSVADLKRAAELAKEAGDEYLEILTTSNIGDFYLAIKQPAKAREIYEQTAERAKRVNDSFNERYALSNLADSYIAAEDWKKVAEIYEQKILPLVRKDGTRREEADRLNLTGVANSYFDGKRAIDFYQQASRIYQELKNPEGEILTLQNIGAAYSDLNDKDKSLENYRQALALAKAARLDEKAAAALAEIINILYERKKYDELLADYNEIAALYRNIGKRDREAEYLNFKAVILGEMKQREKATEIYQSALEIYRSLGDKSKQALILRNIAVNYDWLEKTDEAARFYRQSADLQVELGETTAAVKSLENIVTILQGQKKKTEAIAVREEILALYQNANDAANQAVYLNRIGVMYSDLNDRAKSREYYERAAAIADQADDKAVKAQIWYNIAAEYAVTGKLPEAIELYQKSLALRRDLGLKAEEVETLTRLSGNFRDLRKFSDALEYAQRALALAREIKNNSLEAEAQAQIGNVYEDLKDYPASINAFEESLKIARELKDKKLEANALYGESLTYGDMGNTARGLQLGRESLALFRENEDSFGVIAALDSIAATYLYLGQNQKALEFLEEVLEITRKIGSIDTTGLTLARIAVIYSNEGDNEQAIKFSLDALPYLRESHRVANETTTLINLGEYYAYRKDYEKALEYINQGLTMSREIGAKPKELGALHRLALIAYLKEDTEQARLYLYQSLMLAREIGDKDGEASVLGNLLKLEKYYGDKNLAIFYGKQSVNLNQQIRANLKDIDKDLQQSFLEKNADVYRNLADLLIEQGRIPEAQAVLDLLKEAEFREIAQRGAAAGDTLPYSKAEEATVGIVEKIASVGRELGELKELKKTRELNAAETERLNQLEFTEIPAANKALRQAAEALGNAAPDIKDALDRKMKDNIQNILPDLGGGVVALYTVFGQVSSGLDETKKVDVGWILLVTPEFRKAYPIDTTDLNETVAEFRAVLKSDAYDPQPLARKLYQKLFLQTSDKQKTTLAADLETYFGAKQDKTLMWSLDGVLRYVPMAALHDGKTYLVEKYRNVVFNTASLGSLKDKSQIDWKVLGLGVSEEKTVKTGDGQTMSFNALKGAETELHSIVKDADDPNGILPGTIKLNKDFTKTALLNGVREGNPVIHIASHFSFNPADEEKSFLLLGDGTPLEMSEFEDFPNLFAGVDLLSLSACDTATGGAMSGGNSGGTADANTNGKEVEGFAYVAQTLGAKAVMASLWQVSDEGTKELMLNFYRIRQANAGMPKAEALREAQIALLKGTSKTAPANKTDRTGVFGAKDAEKTNQPPYKTDANAPLAHPYYWSPFILIGNWR